MAGKRDAIIETKGEAPEVLVVAKWEGDYHDVFGPGKELEKLKPSCAHYETAASSIVQNLPTFNFPQTNNLPCFTVTT